MFNKKEVSRTTKKDMNISIIDENDLDLILSTLMKSKKDPMKLLIEKYQQDEIIRISENVLYDSNYIIYSTKSEIANKILTFLQANSPSSINYDTLTLIERDNGVSIFQQILIDYTEDLNGKLSTTSAYVKATLPELRNYFKCLLRGFVDDQDILPLAVEYCFISLCKILDINLIYLVKRIGVRDDLDKYTTLAYRMYVSSKYKTPIYNVSTGFILLIVALVNIHYSQYEYTDSHIILDLINDKVELFIKDEKYANLLMDDNNILYILSLYRKYDFLYIRNNAEYLHDHLNSEINVNKIEAVLSNDNYENSRKIINNFLEIERR